MFRVKYSAKGGRYNVHLHSDPVDRRESVEIHDYVFSEVFELRLHFWTSKIDAVNLLETFGAGQFNKY